MSKQIKQMEMAALASTLGEARDMVLLNLTGLPAQAENQMRLALRKKNIRMHHVKNSLAIKVLAEKGLTGFDTYFTGPTVLVWSTAPDVAISTVSKEIDVFFQKHRTIKSLAAKAAITDGAAVTFEDAKSLPTREEAIGAVVAALLGAGGNLVAALMGPGRKLAGAIKSIEDKQSEGQSESTEPAPASA
ncbi:MAG TPA: 50S ribosomal protein L10 [Gemmatales bacterium]|nr:50S ribosomal protein L10 [Gemmatales bacterium]